jgi:nitrate/nitrite transport system ATP-binding protein
MSAFIEVDHIDKKFPLPDGRQYIALKNIDSSVTQGEFIFNRLFGLCGKSTL